MQIKRIILVFVVLATSLVATAQRLTPEEYIAMYKDLAIREMKRMGVPAAITLAQGILETESGNSVLVKKSNNHFGIKCKSTWAAGGVSHDDDARGECFRQYNTPEESYRDHSNFLRGNDRYGFLFRLDVTDYKGWSYGLKKAGYATNPAYPQILIKNIEQYNLQQYTLEAAADAPKFESGNYTSDPEVVFDPAKDAGGKDDDKDDYVDSVKSLIPDAVDVNGVKTVMAAKGTSLLAIAEKFGIRLIKLLEYNGLAKDGILQKDQAIYLEKNNQAAVTIKAVSSKTHTVQPKEGLYAIARKYNITVQQIREWNSLASDDLKIGQELIIAK